MDTIKFLYSDPEHVQARHYAASNFSASVLNNIFVTYYVEMFLRVSKLTSGWFMAGQVLYCIWNCANDPIMGWLGDTKFKSALRRRIPRIKVGGPLWAMAFVFTWFPWTADPEEHPVLAGLHFFMAMFLYDGTLTWTMVSHQALLADMTSDDGQRERCNVWSAACHLLGAFSVFTANQLWDPKNLGPFRAFTVVCAFIACIGFYITTVSPYINENYGGGALQREVDASLEGGRPKADNLKGSQSFTPSLLSFAYSISGHLNFWVFVVVGLLQQFSCTFNTNFFSLFLGALAGGWVAPVLQSSVLLAAFVVPHLCTMCITPLLRRFGKFAIVRALIVIRLTACVALFMQVCHLLGVNFSTFIPLNNAELPTAFATVHTNQKVIIITIAFLLLNRVLTECVCRLVPLVIADLIDEDYALNRRKATMSSMYFGCHALFTKPGQSIAPMFGWWALQQADPQRLVLNFYGSDQSASLAGTSHVWLVLLQLIFFTPMVICGFMLICWQPYSLKGKYLKHIKTQVQVLNGGSLPDSQHFI